MNRRSLVATIVFASISLAPLGRHVVADEQPLAGFSAESSRAERQWEEKMKAIPDPDKIRAYMKQLSARPHHVGSQYDKDNADWLLAKFKEFGLDAHIETFDVLMPTPKERVVELVDGGPKFTAKLQEPVVPEDPTSNQTSEQLPTYNSYSIDGDVTAPLVYVNFGVPADYEQLERMGVSVKGAIVIARYYGSWRGIKPKVAAEHGAIDQAVLLILKHALLAIGAAGENAKHFPLPFRRVHAEHAVFQTEHAILAGQFLQTARNVHVPEFGPVLRGENQVVAGVIVGSTRPAALPALVAPVAAPPATELGAVEHAALGELKHALLAVVPARENAQHLYAPVIRIRSHRVTVNPKRPVGASQFPQAVGDVHMIAFGAELRVENDILTGVLRHDGSNRQQGKRQQKEDRTTCVEHESFS